MIVLANLILEFMLSKNALNFLGDYTAVIFETLYCNLLTRPVQKKSRKSFFDV